MQRHVQTMVVAQLPTIMTSMVVAQAVRQRVLTTVAVRLPSTMTSMEATSVRQRPDRTMVEAPPQPITISTAIASVLVPAGE